MGYLILLTSRTLCGCFFTISSYNSCCNLRYFFDACNLSYLFCKSSMEKSFTSTQLLELQSVVLELKQKHNDLAVFLTLPLLNTEDDIEKNQVMWEIYNEMHSDGYKNFGRYCTTLWLFNAYNATPDDFEKLNATYVPYLKLNHPLFKKKKKHIISNKYWIAITVSCFFYYMCSYCTTMLIVK